MRHDPRRDRQPPTADRPARRHDRADLDGGRSPLGGDAGASYEDVAFELAPGDWFALFTDGVFERRDQLLDEAVASSLRHLDDEPTAAAVVEAADRSATDRRPTVDDRAVVVLRRLPTD